MARKSEWKPATAEIVSYRISWFRSLAGAGEDDYYTASTTYIADYVYEVDGTFHRRSRHVDGPDRIGETFELTYDPAHPIRNSAPDQTIDLRSPGTWIGPLIGLTLGLLFFYILERFLPGS